MGKDLAMGWFGGSSSSIEIVDLLSGAAQSTNVNLGAMLDKFLTSGQLPFQDQLTVPIPELFNRAFGRASEQFDEFDRFAALNRESLSRQAQGIPAYAFDEGATGRRFQDSFATPLIETYRRDVLPLVEEQFAGIPGGFVSRDRARGVTNELNRFISQTIEPRLFDAYQADIQRGFESGEAAAARVPGAVDQLTRLPGLEFGTFASIAETQRQLRQLPLDIARDEYTKLLSAALGFATTPTRSVVGVQGEAGGAGALGTLVGAGIGGALALGTGGASIPLSMLLSGVVGGGIGTGVDFLSQN